MKYSDLYLLSLHCKTDMYTGFPRHKQKLYGPPVLPGTVYG